MQIKFEECETGGRYYIPEFGSQDVAELTYHYNDDGTITADHTYVPHRKRGKGLAYKLLERLMEDARARDWKIVPSCSYVAAEMRRKPEWRSFEAEKT